MTKHSFLTELEEIHYKYERLASMICLLQMMTAEMIDVVGVPEDSLTNVLFEIELGMDEANSRLKKLIEQKENVA